MKRFGKFLILALAAGCWGMLPSAQGAEIRLASGVRLHYETSGAGGVPVVLVHGYGMSSAVWEKVLPLFPADCRLFALDLRGFGRSEKPETGYGCPELADDIGAFMDALGLSRAVLVGHSFGGLVLQHFAARHPERVLALVLANTFAATAPPKGLSSAVEQRIQGYGSAEANRRLFSAVIPRYFDAAHVTPKDIDRFVEVGLQASNTALRETLRANYITPAIPVPRHEAVRAPVLIVVTTHDPFGTFDQAVAMSDALPNSSIEVIARCGHSPMWEKPSEFAETVAAFLKRELR
ncbi:MAG: alpha/beta hydrolase [Deltaproteobacteria bacterium]|nr:alpha/beta hydrolase [Deltaproteobacteria bacterium]